MRDWGIEMLKKWYRRREMVGKSINLLKDKKITWTLTKIITKRDDIKTKNQLKVKMM